MSDEAKAVQETARVAAKAIDAANDLGNFIARFIGGPLEQASGIVTEKLSYMRWERQVRLMQRAEEFLVQQGLEAPSRPVPMKFAIPLLQAASMEENDDLQDIWAKLLVNAADADSGVDVHRSFVTILEDIGHLEAQILHQIMNLPEEAQNKVIYTAELPQRAISHQEVEQSKSEPGMPEEVVELALWNLVRLGCLSTSATWGGGGTVQSVGLTLLGKALVCACTLAPKS
ncbi:MAG: DUF4393 domain-containing protein [Rhodospirillaceae bacterium]|nr:DUF4393 domain-containing protein [Rhodospirillaceae bacterium]